jgi:hypothetical protein
VSGFGDFVRVAVFRRSRNRFGRVGSYLTIAAVLRRALMSKPKVLARLELKPGDAFEIHAIEAPPKGRRARRKAARARR